MKRIIIVMTLFFCSFHHAGAAEAKTEKSPQEIFNLISQSDDKNKPEIAKFLYEINCPDGGDCYDYSIGELTEKYANSLQIVNVEKDKYIVSVTTSAESYNETNIVFLASNVNNEAKITKILNDSDFDPEKNELVKLSAEDSPDFFNFGYDKENQLFSETSLGNSVGYCTSVDYFKFEKDALVLVKATQTNDCNSSMDNPPEEINEETIYERK